MNTCNGPERTIFSKTNYNASLRSREESPASIAFVINVVIQRVVMIVGSKPQTCVGEYYFAFAYRKIILATDHRAVLIDVLVIIRGNRSVLLLKRTGFFILIERRPVHVNAE